MMCKTTSNTEEKAGMYPPEWWWAERQVSEVLAENPGELVKTGTECHLTFMKQACKSGSYASTKLQPTNRLTDGGEVYSF